MNTPVLKISVEDGKYTVIQEQDGRLHALRHGEPWQDLSGNKLVLTLAQEVKRLREVVSEVHTWIVCACIATPEDMMQNAGRIVSITDLSGMTPEVPAQPLEDGEPAVIPIAMKTHGAWDGLEDLFAVPDGTMVYTGGQVEAMVRLAIADYHKASNG